MSTHERPGVPCPPATSEEEEGDQSSSSDFMSTSNFLPSHDPTRYGHLPLRSVDASSGIHPLAFQSLRYARNKSVKSYLNSHIFDLHRVGNVSVYSSSNIRLLHAADTSVFTPPTRGMFPVALKVDLGDELVINVSKTFNFEAYPPDSVYTYVSKLKKTYGLSARQAATLTADAIHQIQLRCDTPLPAGRITERWKGQGVYREEFQAVTDALWKGDEQRLAEALQKASNTKVSDKRRPFLAASASLCRKRSECSINARTHGRV